ncbi:hypothetical protein JHK87_004555 [Glycine soja]|nr:hypothetical protein JHK87_004555 [Glycine soja]
MKWRELRELRKKKKKEEETKLRRCRIVTVINLYVECDLCTLTELLNSCGDPQGLSNIIRETAGPPSQSVSPSLPLATRSRGRRACRAPLCSTFVRHQPLRHAQIHVEEDGCSGAATVPSVKEERVGAVTGRDSGGDGGGGGPSMTGGRGSGGVCED